MMLFEKRLNAVILEKRKVLPIVKSRSFYSGISQFKSIWFYQVKMATRCQAKTPNIARVIRYFGFEKNNVQCHADAFRPNLRKNLRLLELNDA